MYEQGPEEQFGFDADGTPSWIAVVICAFIVGLVVGLLLQ